jgi:hypothetical protein
VVCGVDKEIFEKVLNKRVQLVNDEHFVISGIVTEVHDNSITFSTNGKTLFLAFDRILEIRPLERIP